MREPVSGPAPMPTRRPWAPAGSWGVLGVSAYTVLECFVLALPCPAQPDGDGSPAPYASGGGCISPDSGSGGNHLLLSFSDLQEPAHLERLGALFTEIIGKPGQNLQCASQKCPRPTYVRSR